MKRTEERHVIVEERKEQGMNLIFIQNIDAHNEITNVNIGEININAAQKPDEELPEYRRPSLFSRIWGAIRDDGYLHKTIPICTIALVAMVALCRWEWQMCEDTCQDLIAQYFGKSAAEAEVVTGRVEAFDVEVTPDVDDEAETENRFSGLMTGPVTAVAEAQTAISEEIDDSEVTPVKESIDSVSDKVAESDNEYRVDAGDWSQAQDNLGPDKYPEPPMEQLPDSATGSGSDEISNAGPLEEVYKNPAEYDDRREETTMPGDWNDWSNRDEVERLERELAEGRGGADPYH